LEAGEVAGFTPHSSLATLADQRDKLERLCRCVRQPGVCEQLFSPNPNGNVRYGCVADLFQTSAKRR